MKTIEIFFIIFFLSFSIISAENEIKEEFGIKFTKIDCKSDDVWVSLHHCLITESSALDIAGKSLKSITKPIDVHVILSIKLGPILYPIIDYKLEWCAIMSGEEKNMVVSLAIALVRDSMPSLFHECPYSGEYEVKNFTLDETMNTAVSQFVPSGKYKLEVSVIKDEKSIVKVGLNMEVKSSLNNLKLD
ncbi:hypothetical protein PVAND_017154 [Polypedilum vanderplanki]|uniref:MD-2-related lipid-recognition domain-containing protein n=1 Tax=Polypedilum vanderplanki TaxID=319348 RepID=A0A9J6BI72_POLVA|nr:hypothetical protein PVAND_017154 [Polypedilum vanderplanki]